MAVPKPDKSTPLLEADPKSCAQAWFDFFGYIDAQIKSLIASVALILPAATQSDQETGTSIVVAVTPGRQQFHPSAVKAWAYFTVSAGTYTKQASYNVASFNKNGTGDVTLTYTTAFSSANYSVSVTSINPSAVTVATTGAITASTARINLFNLSAALVDGNFSVVCLGDQ